MKKQSEKWEGAGEKKANELCKRNIQIITVFVLFLSLFIPAKVFCDPQYIMLKEFCQEMKCNDLKYNSVYDSVTFMIGETTFELTADGNNMKFGDQKVILNEIAGYVKNDRFYINKTLVAEINTALYSSVDSKTNKETKYQPFVLGLLGKNWLPCIASNNELRDTLKWSGGELLYYASEMQFNPSECSFKKLTFAVDVEGAQLSKDKKRAIAIQHTTCMLFLNSMLGLEQWFYRNFSGSSLQDHQVLATIDLSEDYIRKQYSESIDSCNDYIPVITQDEISRGRKKNKSNSIYDLFGEDIFRVLIDVIPQGADALWEQFKGKSGIKFDKNGNHSQDERESIEGDVFIYVEQPVNATTSDIHDKMRAEKQKEVINKTNQACTPEHFADLPETIPLVENDNTLFKLKSSIDSLVKKKFCEGVHFADALSHFGIK